MTDELGYAYGFGLASGAGLAALAAGFAASSWWAGWRDRLAAVAHELVDGWHK